MRKHAGTAIHGSLAACRRSARGPIEAATAHWPALSPRAQACWRYGSIQSVCRQVHRLVGSAAATPGIAVQLATVRGLASSKQLGNLRDVVLGFHKAVNLLSFNLAEVFVIHRATSTCMSGSLEC